MRIGFDVDGVLANFNDAYVDLTVATTGKNLFPPKWFESGTCKNAQPPTWFYPEHFGYSDEDVKKVWTRIGQKPRFWQDLLPYEEIREVMNRFYHKSDRHDVYFVTNRPGETVKWQTEAWLMDELGWEVPTVLITSDKGNAARVLNLDVYIDDKWENALSVVNVSPSTRSYLLNQPYNVGFGSNVAVHRSDSLEDVLRREGLI